MSAQTCVAKHTVLEKQRVLDAHRAGRHDWLAVAACNDIPVSTAYDLVSRGSAENRPRGGARNVKMTPEAKACLQRYLDDDCTYTLETMRSMLFMDCGVKVHTSTISRHLVSMLYTMKQVRIEPTTCNSDVNKEKRRVFAEKLKEHQRVGNCVVYYDETYFNVYLKRLRGRAKRGKRAVVKLPPLKGANLQVQCAVSASIGLVTYRLERGSIRMEQNAAFVEEIYQAVKASDVFRDCFEGKKVVIVLDNAPAHRQTEERVTEHPDMELLRLGPYSPMCNPIEGCFSVLKAHIKRDLAIDRSEICNRSREPDSNGEVLSIAERQMRILERTARDNINVITPALVTNMELHSRDFVNQAAENKDMVYGM